MSSRLLIAVAAIHATLLNCYRLPLEVQRYLCASNVQEGRCAVEDYCVRRQVWMDLYLAHRLGWRVAVDAACVFPLQDGYNRP